MNTQNAARTQRMLRQVQDFDSWAILIFVVGVFAIPVLEYARPLQTQNWAGKCQDAPDGSANQEPVAGERRVKTPMQARAAAATRHHSPRVAPPNCTLVTLAAE